MEDRFDRLERAIQSMMHSVGERFDGMEKRFDTIDQGFEAVDRRFDAVNQRFDELRAELKTEIESVRDDVRIFAEAHVPLERRVTALERHLRLR